MSKITEDQLRQLRERGYRYADIGRAFGLSREMVRRYADQWGIRPVCAGCKAELESAKDKWCPVCRDEKRKLLQARSRPRLKTFANRPVVGEAYEFFSDLGLNVVLNAESKRSEPEIFVNGHGVKCSRIVPVSKGWQVRLGPNDKTEFFFLSDGVGTLVIPAGEVTHRVTYIGANHRLMKYEVGMHGFFVDGLKSWFGASGGEQA